MFEIYNIILTWNIARNVLMAFVAIELLDEDVYRAISHCDKCLGFCKTRTKEHENACIQKLRVFKSDKKKTLNYVVEGYNPKDPL